MWTCTSCNEVHEETFDTCWKCGADRSALSRTGSRSGKETQRLVDDPAPSNPMANLLLDRYEDAYRFSDSLASVGGFVQMAGIAVGFIILLVNIVSMQGMNLSSFLTIAGIVSAIVIGFLIYMLGMGLVAGSQFLKASLDVAVNTSPFLDQEEKAEMLGFDRSTD